VDREGDDGMPEWGPTDDHPSVSETAARTVEFEMQAWHALQVSMGSLRNMNIGGKTNRTLPPFTVDGLREHIRERKKELKMEGDEGDADGVFSLTRVDCTETEGSQEQNELAAAQEDGKPGQVGPGKGHPRPHDSSEAATVHPRTRRLPRALVPVNLGGRPQWTRVAGKTSLTVESDAMVIARAGSRNIHRHTGFRRRTSSPNEIRHGSEVPMVTSTKPGTFAAEAQTSKPFGALPPAPSWPQGDIPKRRPSSQPMRKSQVSLGPGALMISSQSQRSIGNDRYLGEENSEVPAALVQGPRQVETRNAAAQDTTQGAPRAKRTSRLTETLSERSFARKRPGSGSGLRLRP